MWKPTPSLEFRQSDRTMRACTMYDWQTLSADCWRIELPIAIFSAANAANKIQCWHKIPIISGLFTVAVYAKIDEQWTSETKMGQREDDVKNARVTDFSGLFRYQTKRARDGNMVIYFIITFRGHLLTLNISRVPIKIAIHIKPLQVTVWFSISSSHWCRNKINALLA